MTTTGENINIALDESIDIRFDKPVNKVSAEESISLLDAENIEVELSFSFFDQNQLIKIEHLVFDESATYTLTISDDLKGENNESFDEQVYRFATITPPLILESIRIDGEQINPAIRIKDVERNPKIDFHFNTSIAANDLSGYSSFSSNGSSVGYTLNQVDEKSNFFLYKSTVRGI